MKSRFKLLVVSLLIATISMFVFSTCAEDIVKPEETIVIGSIHGIVKNATTGARLSGVTVTWAEGDTVLSVQSTTTDDQGYYFINNLNPGVYSLIFGGKDGFTEYTGTADIGSPDVVEYGDEVYYITVSEDANLYELTGGFKGVIWARLGDGTSKAASGATVQFDVDSSSVVPSVYNTTSGADGAFSLTGLPAGASGNLYVLPYSDGDVAYATNHVTGHSITLTSGEVRTLGEIILTLTIATDAPFLVNSNFEDEEDVKVDATLTGTFSKAIDSASFEVIINGYDPGPEDLAVSWTGNITFTITTSSPFAVGTSYDLALAGMSVDGNSFNFNTDYFRTEDGISLVTTNLWADENMTSVDDFPVDSAITLTFSREVDLYSVDTEIKLYDDSNGLVNGDETLSDDKLVLTFTPSANLETGSNYAISGSVASLLLDDVAYVYETFATAPALVDLPAQVTGAEHDTTYISGDWPVDYDSRTFRFEWTGVVGAVGYNIYAKDTHNNSNYVHVETLPVGDDQVPEATYSDIVTLPGSFDYFEDDGILTPFLHGTQVTFIIRAYNGAGEGPASAEITLSDKQSPTSQTLGSQSGTTNNSGGVIPLEVTVNLLTGEYLSRAGTTISVTGYQVSAVMEWNDTNTGGVVKITIPADSTKVDEELIINKVDTSGNLATDIWTLW